MKHLMSLKPDPFEKIRLDGNFTSEVTVVLKDGTEIEFDADGSWESVDCGASAVPASVVPKAIATYVKNNYRGAKIVEIEVDRKGYDVKLSTGLELKFDRAGKFLRID